MSEAALIKNLNNFSGKVNGENRTWSIYTPDNFVSSKTYPLLIVFKGQTGAVDKMINLFKKQINQYQFIALFPQAIIREGRKATWDVSALKDVNFVSNIISTSNQVFPNWNGSLYYFGISTGSVFANWMALKSEFHPRSICTVAGQLWRGIGDKVNGFPCDVLSIHGGTDNSIPYGGGWAHGLNLYSEPESIRIWGSLNKTGKIGSYTKPFTKMTYPGATYEYVNDDGFKLGLFTVPSVGHDVYTSYAKLNKGFVFSDFVFKFFTEIVS